MPINKQVPPSHIDILEQEIMGMISTIRHRDGLISTNPVTFDWDGELVRFSTLKERVKYGNMLQNRQVTFCVMSSRIATRYVEIRGHVELEDDPGGRFQQALWKKITGEDEFTLDPPGATRVIVTLIPEQVSTPTLYDGQLDEYAR